MSFADHLFVNFIVAELAELVRFSETSQVVAKSVFKSAATVHVVEAEEVFVKRRSC